MSTPTLYNSNPFAAQFASTPSFVNPEMKDRFDANLNMLASHPDADKMLAHNARMDADDGFWPDEDSWYASYRPYVVVDGILQIPVKGVLLNNFPFTVGAWVTGYEYIWRAFERGMDDANVRGIALVIDSPGGLVAGNFDLVDRMFARRDEKPVWSFASESAYSAAYSIASVGERIIVSRTGGVGSIGVVTMHIDASKAYDKMGLAFTYIYAGKFKVDGNSSAPLSDDAKGRIQARVDELYGVFVATVSRNRPQLSEEEVRATEALCYTATQALSANMADEIGSLDDTLLVFASALDDLSDENGEDEMAEATTAVDQAALTAARNEGFTAGKAEGVTEGTAAGATAERGRINAILASDEAKDRPKAAMSTALKSSMSVEDAKAFLSDLPKESATTGKPPKGANARTESFEEAMGRTPNPELRAEQEEGEEGEGSQEQGRSPTAVANSIFASAGFKPRKGE